MALATVPDVEARLGRALTADEATKAPGLLDEASDLVIGYLGCDPIGLPGPIVRVVSRMVARVFLAGTSAAMPNVEQQTAGPFATRFTPGSTSGAPWLTAADKIALKPFRCGGGMVSVPLAGERTP